MQDGSAVTTMPYVPLDITDKEAVEKVLTECRPDVVIHCAAWTAVDLAEDEDKMGKFVLSMPEGQKILQRFAKSLTARWFTFPQTMY